jgi:2,3,4,5-tetrahydropyridine-2-carboxylate N-succinyltransferase
MSFAFGIGIGTQNNQGEWLEVFYQQPVLTPDNGLIEVARNVLEYRGGNQAIQAKPDQSLSL